MDVFLLGVRDVYFCCSALVGAQLPRRRMLHRWSCTSCLLCLLFSSCKQEATYCPNMSYWSREASALHPLSPSVLSLPWHQLGLKCQPEQCILSPGLQHYTDQCILPLGLQYYAEQYSLLGYNTNLSGALSPGLQHYTDQCILPLGLQY